MNDPLAMFREESSAGDAAVTKLTHRRSLLLFEHDGALLGVPAEAVDGVIAWRNPVRLPRASAGFAGVVQDRGRIVAVLESPLGGVKAEPRAARRLVVCATARGFLGLPADTTRGVTVVEFAIEPPPGEIVDSSEGPLTLVLPALLARASEGGDQKERHAANVTR